MLYASYQVSIYRTEMVAKESGQEAGRAFAVRTMKEATPPINKDLITWQS